jgi:hypothetical protein
LLEQLSTHLSGYFGLNEDGNVVELQKTDIPDIIFTNRFLKQFSEDTSSREAFSPENGSHTSIKKVTLDDNFEVINEEVISTKTSSGAVYSR